MVRRVRNKDKSGKDELEAAARRYFTTLSAGLNQMNPDEAIAIADRFRDSVNAFWVE